jgi:D-alanyl-D-alanine carboxypeptidase/D-alanyl-D-alanine-endopeptidase (penicillin-binding protein 4)
MGFTSRAVMGWVAGLSVLWNGGAAYAQGLCRAALPARIDAISTQPSLRHAHMGILVETLNRAEAQRQELYARNADQSFIPASNIKLLTTAAALQRLGADYRVRTVVYGSQNNGLTTLQVVGKGDPSLGDRQLRDLAQQLANRGISRVTHLIGYDGYFPGPAIHPNWEWEDMQAGYGAEINGLMWNENELVLTLTPQAPGQPLGVQWGTALQPWQVENFSQTVRTGQASVSVWRPFSQPLFRIYGQLPVNAGPETLSLALPGPANFFVQRFQQLLEEAGVAVLQTSVTAQANPSTSTTEFAAVTSTPLAEWIVKANQRSNNQYAEALLKTLGMAVSRGTAADATIAGTEAVKAVQQAGDRF